MTDIKALVDLTSEQTSAASGDLLFIESAGTPAKITFGNLVDNDFTYSSVMTVSGTFTVTGTVDVSGGTLTLADDQIAGAKVAAATDTTRGTVEKSTSAENVAGTATDVFPDVAGVSEMIAGGTTVTLIAETDLSGVATHDIALDTSSYDLFKVFVAHMIPASGTDSLVGLFSTDGGSTYDTGASDYDWVLKRILGTSDSDSRSTDSEMVIATVVGSGTTQDGVSGELSIIAPGMARETVMRFQGVLTAGDGTFQMVESAGRHNSQAAVDYLRLKFSGGNIESGKVLVYGYKGA